MFERKRGVRSSGLLTLFWISLVIYGVIKTRTLSLIAEDDKVFLYFVFLFVSLFGVFVCTILCVRVCVFCMMFEFFMIVFLILENF